MELKSRRNNAHVSPLRSLGWNETRQSIAPTFHVICAILIYIFYLCKLSQIAIESHVFFSSLGDFSSKQDSSCDRNTEFSPAGVAVVISSNQTPSQEWGCGVCFVWVPEKGPTNWSGTWCPWSPRFSTNMSAVCSPVSCAALWLLGSWRLFIALFPTQPGPESASTRT